MVALTGIVLAVAALVVAVLATRGVRADARRLSNAALIGLALVLAGVAVTLLGSHGVIGVAMMVMVTSPLLVSVLVGFLVWNGLTMVRKEGRSLGNLLSLLAGVAIIAAVTTCLVLMFTAPQAMPLMLFVVLACAWVGALFCGYLAYSWFYQRRVGAERPDFIVVLGSGLIGDRVPPLLAGRIDRGIRAWTEQRAAGRQPVLVMSGGQGPDELVSEASAMAGYAIGRGVPAADVLVEDRSRTTAENLRNTLDLVQQDPRLGPGARGIAVTSNYHAMRAAGLARSLGTTIDVLGAPTARYFWPSAVLREFVAIVRASLTTQLVAGLLVTLPLPLAFWYAMHR